MRPIILPRDSTPHGARLLVRGARHPMLELALGGEFVPNDIALGEQADGRPRALVLTGPNMGGKSCYIRTAALIAIMAQLGSFVPAQRAELTPLDAVFTRMGASDSLALGRSTFLEELGEASSILAQATPWSLVILDELGRGTSTEDGVAVALATLEHLARETRCLSLFVTHYPEIPAAVRAPPLDDGTLRLGRMAVLERGGDPPAITFLHRLEAGAAEASFGLNVARMAGVPESVVARAKVLAAAAEGPAPLLAELCAALQPERQAGLEQARALQAQVAAARLSMASTKRVEPE